LIDSLNKLRDKISNRVKLLKARRNFSTRKALMITQRLLPLENSNAYIYPQKSYDLLEEIYIDNSTYVIVPKKAEILSTFRAYIQDLIDECNELNPSKVLTEDMIKNIVHIALLKCNFMLENKFLGD